MRTHQCPGGCGTEVAYARLSCPACWARLPRVLKDEVNAAYRRRASDPLGHLRAVQVAVRWYSDQGSSGE